MSAMDARRYNIILDGETGRGLCAYAPGGVPMTWEEVDARLNPTTPVPELQQRPEADEIARRLMGLRSYLRVAGPQSVADKDETDTTLSDIIRDVLALGAIRSGLGTTTECSTDGCKEEALWCTNHAAVSARPLPELVDALDARRDWVRQRGKDNKPYLGEPGNEGFLEGFKAAFALSTSGLSFLWISVKDRLPPHGGEFFIATNTGYVTELQFSTEHGWHDVGRLADDYWSKFVTHWADKPATPSESTLSAIQERK